MRSGLCFFLGIRDSLTVQEKQESLESEVSSSEQDAFK